MDKKVFQSLNLIGSISLAVTVPWILFRVFRAVHLKKKLNQLSGKVVVITGASSGLGEAIAYVFYKQGCQVVLCSRRRQELERVKAELLQTKPKVTTYEPVVVPLDLSDFNNLDETVAKILKITNRIDILINNGGVSHRGFAVDTKPDVDLKIMSVNYFGAIALTKAVLPVMIKRKSGHVVFISSIQGLVALPQRSAYSASKYAMQAFTDCLRAEVASDNISVTIISPGYIKTKLSLNALTGSGDLHGQMDAATASGYTPEYVAEQTLQAIVTEKKELVICTMMPRIAIFLRKYIPCLYFYVMEKRAKKPTLQQSSS